MEKDKVVPSKSLFLKGSLSDGVLLFALKERQGGESTLTRSRLIKSTDGAILAFPPLLLFIQVTFLLPRVIRLISSVIETLSALS